MPKKFWMRVLFAFSAIFFVLATYHLVLLLMMPAVAHAQVLYRIVAGYFLCVILYLIASQKRKKLNRKIFK